MTKFSKFGKNGLSGLGYRSIQFSQDQRRIKARAKLKDLKIQGCFEAWKMIKKYQWAKMEEIQAQSRGRKNQTIWFGIPEYPFFPE
jgi:hypothetical protein